MGISGNTENNLCIRPWFRRRSGSSSGSHFMADSGLQSGVGAMASSKMQLSSCATKGWRRRITYWLRVSLQGRPGIACFIWLVCEASLLREMLPWRIGVYALESRCQNLLGGDSTRRCCSRHGTCGRSATAEHSTGSLEHRRRSSATSSKKCTAGYTSLSSVLGTRDR